MRDTTAIWALRLIGWLMEAIVLSISVAIVVFLDWLARKTGLSTFMRITVDCMAVVRMSLDYAIDRDRMRESRSVHPS